LQYNYQQNVAISSIDFIFDIVLTFFYFLSFAIPVCFLFVGAYSNLAFFAIIFVYMSIGFFHDILARILVHIFSIVANVIVL
ncbi:ATPase, partial [Enterococcus faecalis]